MKNKIICKLIGHKWLYSWVTKDESNKCMCQRCRKKLKFNPDKNKWESVSVFEGDVRTDEELIYQWY